MPLRDRQKAVRDAQLEDLLGRVQQQQMAVQEALGRRELQKAPRRETARRLLLGRLFDHLEAFARLLRLNGPAVDLRVLGSLGGLLDRVDQLLQAPARRDPGLLTYRRLENFYQPAQREAGWELVSELECALLEVGGDRYLAICLEEERKREDGADGDALRWSDVHDIEKLIDLQRQLAGGTAPKPAFRNEVIELLARLYQARSDADWEYRAQENLRLVRLRWTCRILMVAIVVAAGLLVPRLVRDWVEGMVLVALVITPAVLGGTLGSVRSLRSEELTSRSGEQPRYRWAFIAQLLVSSTFGLLILVLTGLEALPFLEVPPDELVLDDPVRYYTLFSYSFLVGFSEPFTLNIERFISGAVV